jgi:dephospho-CoA kinase
MFAVGLSGGIGSGKSTVADLLVDFGAVLIDADQVARDIVEPGRPVLAALVERFGTSILDVDGHLDRLALARETFGDAQALAALNALTHPAIGLEMIERRARYEHSDVVVVFAVPLLREEHRTMLHFDTVVVVDCPTELTLERLVAHRGMDRDDAERRIAAQMSREERTALADRVIDNSGDVATLTAATKSLWEWLNDQRVARGGNPRG